MGNYMWAAAWHMDQLAYQFANSWNPNLEDGLNPVCDAATAQYLADNPDVAADGYYGQNPWQHYVDYGQYEGRRWHVELCPGMWLSTALNQGANQLRQANDILQQINY